MDLINADISLRPVSFTSRGYAQCSLC